MVCEIVPCGWCIAPYRTGGLCLFQLVSVLLLPGNFCNVHATTDCLIVDFISNGCHVNDLEVFSVLLSIGFFKRV